jgi:mRNA interferase MazF
MTYQWNIFWADLNPVRGSEQAGTRPVLVISEEAVNQALPIVTVLCLTTYKKGRKIYPVELYLDCNDSKLDQPSIVMAHQIRSIAKERLTGRCGQIASEAVKDKIRAIIKLQLDLP